LNQRNLSVLVSSKGILPSIRLSDKTLYAFLIPPF
jgi:hypothetical protein